MSNDDKTQDRKSDHLDLALKDKAQRDREYFEDYHYEHRALPDLDYADIDITTSLFGHDLSAPLMITGMTGGTERAGRINERLAEAAAAEGIAFGVGSQRVSIEKPDTASTFRTDADTLTVANLGAVQLNTGMGIDEARRAVEMINADALAFHINALQEAIQPEGDRDFRTLAVKMGAIQKELSVPVIAKEIGCGLDPRSVRKLLQNGITHIDASGSGGTSWAWIEGARDEEARLGETFKDWGTPTPLAVQRLSKLHEIDTLIGSGGVRSGLDAAKCLTLGADIAGAAGLFLKAVVDDEQDVRTTIQYVKRELKTAMFCTGSATLDELRDRELT